MIVTPTPSISGSITYKPQVVDEVEVAFELLKSQKDNIHNIGKEQLLKFRERALPYLTQGLGSKENWWVRRSSAMMIKTLTQQGVNTEEAIPALIQALRSKEVEVVIFSSAALVTIGKKSVPALLETLDKNPYNKREVNHKYWHQQIIEILGGIKEGARDAVDHLNLMLDENNLDLSLYEIILCALRRIGGRKAITIIKQQALKKDFPEGTARKNLIAINRLAEIALSKYEDPTSTIGVFV